MTKAKLEAVILDVDGTLIDSNDAHAKAWVDAFVEFGIKVTFEDVRPLIGMGGDNLMPVASGLQSHSELGKKIEERRGEIFLDKYFPTLKPFPRSRDLLCEMQKSGLELVVASSSGKDGLKRLLEQAGVADLIEEKTSADDAKNSKPDPDIVKAALQKSGRAARSAIMLGDTPYDVSAAALSGVACVALRCGGWGDDALAGAVEIYDNPAHLLENFQNSIFARAREQT